MVMQLAPSSLQKIIEQYEEDKFQRDSLEKQYKELISTQKALETRLEDAESARIIIQRVAKRILSNLEVRISNLVTLALNSVSSEWPEEFVARVETRRNQMEVDLLFKEHDVEQPPMESSGFGPVDVAAFTLRPSFWSLNKNRPTMILDEPFRNVSPDLQHKVSQMLTLISKKLKIQFLIVSHADNINMAADKTFIVEKKNGVSYVIEEQEKKVVKKLKLIRRK